MSFDQLCGGEPFGPIYDEGFTLCFTNMSVIFHLFFKIKTKLNFFLL